MVVARSAKTSCLCTTSSYNKLRICPDPPVFDFGNNNDQMAGPHCLRCAIWHLDAHFILIDPSDIYLIKQYLIDHPEAALEL